MSTDNDNDRKIEKMTELSDEQLSWYWAWTQVDSLRDMSHREMARWVADGAPVAMTREEREQEMSMGVDGDLECGECGKTMNRDDAWVVTEGWSVIVLCSGCTDREQAQ